MNGEETKAMLTHTLRSRIWQERVEDCEVAAAEALAALATCIVVSPDDVDGRITRVVVFYRGEDEMQRYVEIEPS